MHDVIIDIGHFGAESGAVAQGYKECDLTKAIGDKVINILANEYKMNVGVTSGTLAARTDYENKVGCKAFVSIHCNAGGGTGFESWIYSTGTPCEKLASSLNTQMEKLGVRNRGIKVNPDFWVLKRTKAPAVIHEVGFIDSNDITYLTTRQNEIARHISTGIANFLGKSPEISSPSTHKVITIEKGIKTIEIRLQ